MCNYAAPKIIVLIKEGNSPEGTNNGRRSIGKPCQNKPNNEQGVVNVQEIQNPISHN